jgi:hypothetical protein
MGNTNFADPHVSVVETDDSGIEIIPARRRPIRTYAQIVNNSKNLTDIIEKERVLTDNNKEPYFKKILNIEETAIDIEELKKIIDLSDKVSEEKLNKYEEIITMLDINLTDPNRDDY